MTTWSSTNLVVTRADLDRSLESGNLMAALQRIRPWFLSAAALRVSVDGLVFADPSVLHFVTVTDVCQVRLRRGTSTSSTPSVVLPNGMVSSGDDLIEVVLRRDATGLCPF